MRCVLKIHNKAMKKNGENKTILTRDEIRDSLRSGDHVLISEIEDCTPNYVRMVLRGDRNNKNILTLAVDLIENRQAFIAKHKKKDHEKN